jgi:cytochrome bd ubiquinol oxidase subunit I
MLDGFDALLLMLMQFAFAVSFNSIFPAFTIGLACYLAVLEDAKGRQQADLLRELS